MIFTVKLDGRQQHEIINSKPQEFRNVFVYGSIQGKPPADVWVKNFEFDNINDEDLGKEILKGNNIIAMEGG